MADDPDWRRLMEEIISLRAFSIAQAHTINAYRYLLEDLLAEVAASKPEPIEYLDKLVLSFHAVTDEAMSIMADRPKDDLRVGRVSDQVSDEGFQAARREYEHIAEAAIKRVRHLPAKKA